MTHWLTVRPLCGLRLILLVVLLHNAAVTTARAADTVEDSVAVGELLPDAPLQGLNGPSRRLSRYIGRPLLINVWASWCGPCRSEMASLERLAWKRDSELTVIGISTDDYAHRAAAFLAKSNATISHFIDHRLQLETLLGASRLPLTVLVDAEGRVLHKIFGAREWDSAQAEALITHHLGLADKASVK